MKRSLKRFFQQQLMAGAVLVGTVSLLAACAGGSGGSEHAPVESDNRPDPAAPITDPPVPPPVTANPLKGAKLFVDPQSNAMLRANSLRQENPEHAALLDRIAQQPQALWMGEWNSDIFRAVQHFVKRAIEDGSVPVMIAYNIPYRDYGAKHSEGGLATKEAYQRWIRNVHAGIGDNPAVVVLEPDALPGVSEKSPLPPNLREERLVLINDAIRVLRQNPKAAVYIDAGHAAWVPAEEMAELLKKAGVEHASGFSLNTSNYRTTEECLEYGTKISELIGGKHFIIDTSRNGAGPYLEAKSEEETWCNPPGRKIGKPPTTDTGHPLCDGFLWLKRPGESDGECNGGPRAGVFWMEQALQYAQ
jgi:endoglucanase